MTEIDELQKASNWLQERVDIQPKVGLILGSGLSRAVSENLQGKTFDWKSIPNFPSPTVEGHEGKLGAGIWEDVEVLIQKGRVHWYEGKNMSELIFSIRLMALLEVETLIITNAAGGINRDFNPGDLVVIKDHINFCGSNPLRGENLEELGPRFPDMSNAYNPKLRQIAFSAAAEIEENLKEGVYIMTSGPSYETPAEIEAFGSWGADLVGMSTVPEVIAANHCGLEVLGLSCVTNMAAGLQDKLTHEEVIETTEQANDRFAKLLSAILEKI
ncbi:MAG: purine-nucleoside phosphorylase [Candidatus Bipolaricaulota bacterium]